MPAMGWRNKRNTTMDIDSLKGKTLDDATHAALVAHVSAISARAETAEEKARKAASESINGRKTLKAERDAAFAKLGIDSVEELDGLPDSKGQAEASKQFEVQLKKLQREHGEAVKARDELAGKLAGEARKRAIAEAVAKHPFIDAEDAAALIGARVQQEGDELLFLGEGGKLVPVSDGAAWMAKTKPHLVKATGGSGGSGFNGGGGGAQAKNPYAAGSLNLTQQIALERENPSLAASLKAASGEQKAAA